MLRRTFFAQHPVDCARALIGTEFAWDDCRGIVVETEAYAEHGDEACHTFLRPSARRFLEDHPAGTAYVYLNYGVHWLTNVLIKGETNGFVLIRALEPVQGIERMQERREKERLVDLCSGPGKLSRAMGIDGRHHGSSLVHRAARAFHPATGPGREILTDVRIGISSARDLPWRFLAGDSPHVSVKVKAPPA